MAVKTCKEVIDGSSYAGEDGKQVTRDSECDRGSDRDFLDSVMDAAGYVNNTASAIYNYDC